MKLYSSYQRMIINRICQVARLCEHSEDAEGQNNVRLAGQGCGTDLSLRVIPVGMPMTMEAPTVLC